MLQHALFNKTPTANPAQSPGHSAAGVVTGNLNASDPNGDQVTYTVTQQPTHGSVVVNPDGRYTYTPNNTDLANFGGPDHFTVSVDDGTAYRTTDVAGAILGLFHSLAQAIGLSGPDTKTVTVTVSDPGTPIVGTPMVGVPSWAGGTGSVLVTAVFTDPAGGDLNYSAPTTSTGGGSVVYNGSDPGLPYFVYTPSAAQIEAATPTSTDTFTITASNGWHTATQTVTVPVIQDIPSATDNSGAFGGEYNSMVDGSVRGQVQFRDPAGHPLTISVPSSSTGGGTIQYSPFPEGPIAGGSFTYIPTQAQRRAAQTATGTVFDTFTVAASNGVHTTTQTIIVPVLPSPPPTATATVPVGNDPSEVALSPDGSKLYVTNLNDNTVSVIDTATNRVTATIPVGKAPEGVAVSPNGTVYVTNISDGTVSVLGGGNAVTKTISVPGCGGCTGGPGPNAVAFSSNGRYAYVAKVPPNNTRYGTVSVVDTLTSAVITGITVGPAGTYPQDVAYAYTSSGERLYVANVGPTGSYGTVSVIGITYNGSTTPTLTPAATINVGTKGNFPVALAVSPDGSHVYVVNNSDGTVSVINTATNSVTATIPVGSGPQQVAVSPDGTRVYVTNGASNTVSVINTSTNTVTNTIEVGTLPDGIAVSPDGQHIYVANSGSNTVSVIAV
ncbi:beta-propeller fold lactonase family protein [Mycobacterium sp. RTGN5]|uniref:beta-propeller fold lactonase family protein n=1 Tax=Mycobacterium sp. RTGN5 TaxID=3016522 RepID=UPI0029C70B2B|nr:beta-propeller fold lactonase family protein [Mycobacterium sp. RTGN5]